MLTLIYPPGKTSAKAFISAWQQSVIQVDGLKSLFHPLIILRALAMLADVSSERKNVATGYNNRVNTLIMDKKRIQPSGKTLTSS